MLNITTPETFELFLFYNYFSPYFLFQENKELRLALEEHQNVMELIMSKYRQQVAQLVTVNAQPSQPSTQEQAKVVSQPTLPPVALLKISCLSV